MRKLHLAVMAAGMFFYTACNSDPSSSDHQVIETESSSVPEGAVGEDGKIHLTIEGNDAMKFNKKELRAKEGVPIRLVLSHTGKMPKQEMGHNIVVLKEGVDFRAFALKAAEARETDYIPASEMHNIIAYSKLIGGGEFTVLEFTIPAKGTYPFLCSFPGHANLMKGEFIVE